MGKRTQSLDRERLEKGAGQMNLSLRYLDHKKEHM